MQKQVNLLTHPDPEQQNTTNKVRRSIPGPETTLGKPKRLALLGVVLIGSVVGIGLLIAGGSVAPAIDQNAPIGPAVAESGSVAAGIYQPGALAGDAPEAVTKSAEEGRLIDLAAVEKIHWQALLAAGCGPEAPECVPAAGDAATHGGLSSAETADLGSVAQSADESVEAWSAAEAGAFPHPAD